MSLEAKNLSFRYRRGQPPVLQAVNLTVHPGERVGLRGPSGRGKTTLCKLLAGYERPCGGQVLLNGRPLEALHIAPAWLDRYPTELSGGELQRFCIARALRPETRFLLCDEITAMLDLVTQAQIWEFLLDVASRRDLGLLIVSHQSLLLEKLCTRIEQLDV